MGVEASKKECDKVKALQRRKMIEPLTNLFDVFYEQQRIREQASRDPGEGTSSMGEGGATGQIEPAGSITAMATELQDAAFGILEKIICKEEASDDYKQLCRQSVGSLRNYCDVASHYTDNFPKLRKSKSPCNPINGEMPQAFQALNKYLEKYLLPNEVSTYITGSALDNTAVSVIFDDKLGQTDVDVMLCYKMDGEVVDVDDFPGYVNVKQNEAIMFTKDDDGWIKSDTFVWEMFLQFQEQFPELVGNILPSLKASGPAQGLYFNRSKTEKYYDIVLGFRKNEWPALAEQWQYRSRSSGWPAPSLIDKIVSKGFAVVPVAHKLSPNPDIEFRYSFSEAEVLLMLDISQKQKKCFMIVKGLCKYIQMEDEDDMKIFTTYYVKTLFLWMMEEKHPTWWEKSEAIDCAYELMDKIIFSCVKKKISNYFIPQANLIDHISQGHLQEFSVSLVNLREMDPKQLRELVMENKQLEKIFDMDE